MLPKYLKETITPQQKGRKQEEIARKTINSGSTLFDKGDIEVNDTNDSYRVDTKKVTSQTSYNISLKFLDKFWNQSSPQTPVLMIYIGDYKIKAIIEKIKKTERQKNG